MLDFTSNGALPASADPSAAAKVWYRSPLQPFSDILSPFSYSVLAEISGRAWFRYYDRLGVSLPYAPTDLTRHFQGRAYFDIKWPCQQDAAFAGLEPLTFQVDGRQIALCSVEKGGLLSGFRSGRNQKKIEKLLESLTAETEAITASARQWHEKVHALRWTQAEILQIMEEIERVSVDSLMLYYAARHNLERAYHQLVHAVKGNPTETVRQINTALSDLDDLREVALTRELLELAQSVADQPVVLSWLQGSDAQNWQKTVPAGEFAQQLQRLLDGYGHWATSKGEMANPRWAEQPGFLFKGILACAKAQARPPARVPSEATTQKLLESIPGGERKAAQKNLQAIRQLLPLQSRALDAFAYILAGTRRWALAAAQEAMGDDRLRSVDEAFLFQLEELKRMMTGEWNITNLDEIHALAEQRRAECDRWAQAHPGPLLFDDVELFASHPGVPSVEGVATGPLRRQEGLQPVLCADAVVGARQLDSGWAPVLPVAGGIVAAEGSPLDPIFAAARIWHVPAVVALGQKYENLVDGAQTTLDGATGEIDQ